ncbi:FAD-binding protein [Kutzneria buriramensis]|uniref:3-oxo-5alpha-steroid 4-dehydrogenase n=1 Tax=Kutzneria buriramensis TaxID=1045776 RepID=A0A3E0H312_9PSEU|nr:FAD-binding protein [Kutzneria buriramensis]REH37171.1 3-oxo-5alpha-steroid 4-dehydrogenase [Kutzneria buriramensis]
MLAGVVVVGFGAAGACAAIEAAEAGADVVVLDRFDGGGATALSGGVVYAGGGTAQQAKAGIADTTDAMYDYLAHEVGDAVTAQTLRAFCDGSPDMLAWLQDKGVPFAASVCPYKTSYPTNRHYLYYSGSETLYDNPAPRGHRTAGRGTSGKLLFHRLERAAIDRGVRILRRTTAQRLITDPNGRVVGVVCRQLTGFPARLHRFLGRLAAKPGLYVPSLRRRLHRSIRRIEARHGTEITVNASEGVILCAGGFVANPVMMKEHAPAYRRGLPLGTLGDDGSGIRLGAEVGGATDKLDHVSAWRFVTPPSALMKGRLINESGDEICDLNRYGAAVGHAMITEHGGKGWLLVDGPTLAEAKRQIPSQTTWFQRLQTHYLFARARTTAGSLDELSRRTGVTIKDFDGAPPFSLIDVSVKRSVGYPCPMLTLGGLVVDEDTGAVLSDAGTPVPGLYAAGRNAVGICSNSYVSGLSLADCVYSGRRAGRHVAAVRRSGAQR